MDLLRAAYEPTLHLQRKLVEQVQTGHSEHEFLVLAEHDPPVITLGVGASQENILASPAELAAAGITVHKTRRGGDVMYHGPGQLVGYLILALTRHGRNLRQYLRDLEDVLIGALGQMGLKAARQENMAGVWVEGQKVAAIGVAVSRWVTYHGFALNAAPNMAHFDLIVPCGLRDRPVTSLENLLGRAVRLDEVKPLVTEHLVEVFGFDGWEPTSKRDLSNSE
jgi:lipoate-protein ligase B